jgi:hypothetical protein
MEHITILVLQILKKYKPAAVVTKVVATPVAVEAVKAQPKVVASKVVTK